VTFMFERMKNSKLLMRQIGLVAIVFAFVFCLSFANAIYHWKSIEKQETENRAKEISGCFSTMTDLDQSMKLLSMKVLNNEQVQEIRYDEAKSPETIGKIKDLSNLLNTLQIGQSSIYSIYVTYQHTDLVVTTDGSMHFDTFVQSCDLKSQIPDLDVLMKQRGQCIVVPDIYVAQKNMYVTRSPACTLYLCNDDSISVFIFLSNENVKSTIDNLLYSDENFAVVLNGAGNVLFHSGEYTSPDQFESIQQYISELERLNGGHHISVMQNQQIISLIGAKTDRTLFHSVDILLFIMMGSCAVFAAFLYSLLNQQMYQPINQIIKNFNLSAPKSSIDEYALISTTLSGMEEKISELNSSLEEKQRSAMSMMINHMLAGISNQVIPESFQNNQGWVIISIACEEEHGGNWEDILRFANAQMIGHIKRLRIFMIEAEYLTEYFSDLLAAHEDCYAAVGISGVHHAVNELRAAYEESLEIFECADPQVIASGLMWRCTAPNDGGRQQSIPLDLPTVTALIGAVTQQDTQLTLSLIRRLFEKKMSIIQRRNLSIYIVQLMQMMQNTYGHHSKDCSSYIQQIELLLSVQSMLKVIEELCMDIEFGKQKEEDELLSSIIQFINTHYMEDISLQTIADEVNLAYTYVSGYFKSKQGVNFQKYLTMVRIEHAQELLCQSDLSVSQIAEQVGFGTTNTFIRNMKQISGITPDTYRRIHQGSGLGSDT